MCDFRGSGEHSRCHYYSSLLSLVTLTTVPGLFWGLFSLNSLRLCQALTDSAEPEFNIQRFPERSKGITHMTVQRCKKKKRKKFPGSVKFVGSLTPHKWKRREKCGYGNCGKWAFWCRILCQLRTALNQAGSAVKKKPPSVSSLSSSCPCLASLLETDHQ